MIQFNVATCVSHRFYYFTKVGKFRFIGQRICSKVLCCQCNIHEYHFFYQFCSIRSNRKGRSKPSTLNLQTDIVPLIWLICLSVFIFNWIHIMPWLFAHFLSKPHLQKCVLVLNQAIPSEQLLLLAPPGPSDNRINI